MPENGWARPWERDCGFSPSVIHLQRGTPPQSIHKGVLHLRIPKQFGIILSISFLGELLHALLPLPVPASIYGIVILFACLELKLLPVSAVKETSSFLIQIMPVMFIPAAVGLIDAWGVVKSSVLQYLAITVVSTFAVMIVAGRVTQAIIRRSKKKEAVPHA